jgi:RNA polymerase sigma factor (sigma-70 family)
LQEGEHINQLTDHLFREHSGKITAVLTRLFGLNQMDVVQDAVQETFEAALISWKFSGTPDNPAGWLMKVAKNKAISVLRRDSKSFSLPTSGFTQNFDQIAEEELDRFFLPHEVEDSQLKLLLCCCHPGFSERNQVILTLNILCGFGIAEIAVALLMQEETVKKALARMKAELREQNSILLEPGLPRNEHHVSTVHTILYLMYNEGYKTTRAKEMINNDLCYEAIRLAKLLLRNDVALAEETQSLLALMFFNLARFPSRLSSEGEIITLAEQDRSKWNRVFIEEAYSYLNQATGTGKLNRFYLEAVIASLHCTANTFDQTDWKTIVFLYEQLEKIMNSPMVTLNKIVAQSYLHEPAMALEQMHHLKENPAIKNYYLLYATEGHLFLRMKRNKEAKEAFIKAQQLATSPLDRQFLKTKIAQC